MAPIREYPAVIHGQPVTVKVYPPTAVVGGGNNWTRPPKGGWCHGGLHNYYTVDQGFWASPAVPVEVKPVDLSDCEP